MIKSLKFCALLPLALSLQACTNMSLFKDNATDTAVAAQPLPPEQPDPGVSAGLSSGQIKSLLTGKSWRWKGPKNSGVTLYASDGTSLVEVTGKGTTQGKWVAKDGQLCESFAPAPFLPQGVPLTCQPFTGSAGNYRVGQASFNLAS